MVDWRQELETKWSGVRLAAVRVTSQEGKHLFEVDATLNGIDPAAVTAGALRQMDHDGAPVHCAMKRNGPGFEPVPGGRACGPPGVDYTGAHGAAVRRRCDPAGGGEDSMAAVRLQSIKGVLPIL